jgi:D-glycero-D-manno-heptose 1,7-bisphosphate phosphatase
VTAGGRHRAVILDRDGTLNREQGFIRSPADLHVLPGVPAALRQLAGAGFLQVVVTNQSGIARGLYTETDLARVHEELHRRLDRLPRAYLHCPHHPDPEFAASPYGRRCDCRKPAAGMLREADELWGIDWARSFLVGDAGRDLLMGSALSATRILLQTGKPWREQLAGLQAAGCPPHHVVADLPAAVQVICGTRP